jgi:hypothetical protein
MGKSEAVATVSAGDATLIRRVSRATRSPSAAVLDRREKRYDEGERGVT